MKGGSWRHAVSADIVGSAVIDLPAYIFVEELIAACPEAKMLITPRDSESC